MLYMYVNSHQVFVPLITHTKSDAEPYLLPLSKRKPFIAKCIGGFLDSRLPYFNKFPYKNLCFIDIELVNGIVAGD